MRGADSYNESLFSTVRLEEFVPQTHPLRTDELEGAPTGDNVLAEEAREQH